MFDPDRFISDRLRAIDASGIRRVFDLAAQLDDPVNLSIGQPHFDVPEPIKRAAIEAIEKGFNQYTVTQGLAELRQKVRGRIESEFPNWAEQPDYGALVVSGVSGGLVLALLTCVQPGDECGMEGMIIKLHEPALGRFLDTPKKGYLGGIAKRQRNSGGTRAGGSTDTVHVVFRIFRQ